MKHARRLIIKSSLGLLFLLTLFVGGKTVKADFYDDLNDMMPLTVANDVTDYKVIEDDTYVYNSQGKKSAHKVTAKIKRTGQTLKAMQFKLAYGTFVNVQGKQTINGQEFYQIGPNEFVKAKYVQQKSEVPTPTANVQDDSDEFWDDDETDNDETSTSNYDSWASTSSRYNLSETWIDNTSSKNKMIKNAIKLLGYFHYGSGSLRTQYGSIAKPNKKGYTDCSSFVWLVMRKTGYYKAGSWPFYTKSMEIDAHKNHRYLRQIKPSEAKAGDIVIANVGNGLGNNGHTAILDGPYNGWDTQIIQEGGDDGTGPVHRSHLGDSLGEYLMAGKITYARPIK